MMKEFSRTVESMRDRKFDVTDKGAIKQTERNTVKQEVLLSFLADLPQEYVVGLTKKGIALRLPNTNEGSLPVILDIVFKNLDADLEGLVDEKTKAVKDAEDKRVKQEQKVARARAKRAAEIEKDKTE